MSPFQDRRLRCSFISRLMHLSDAKGEGRSYGSQSAIYCEIMIMQTGSSTMSVSVDLTLIHGRWEFL